VSSLGKWQIFSIISRFSALVVGLLQSVIITRILTVSEFGLVGIVGAVGALFGIAQHLGLASGTTREISASKGEEDVFKIFVSSVAIKYIITLPIALGLFILAPYLSEHVYKHSEIIFPLRLYSLVLVIQGVQSIFNSVIAGLQRFKRLFLYQACISLVSLVLYAPLVFYYRVNGYFIALTLFNVVSSFSLAFLALWPIRSHLKLPSGGEFKLIFRNVLILSLGIYFVKVLYTLWYKFGQITLGYFESLEVVGIFSFAVLYSSKLMAISDALTDVNLPVFSKEFTQNLEGFKKLFHENFDKLYVLILFAALSQIYFSKEIILFAVGSKYSSVFPIIVPLVLAFTFYSYVNIIKSSILIPSKMIVEMSVSYFILLFTSVASFFMLSVLKFSSINSMSLALFLGSALSFISLYFMIKRGLKFNILDQKFLVLTICLTLITFPHFFVSGFLLRFLFYLVYSLICLYVVDKLKVISIKRLILNLKR